jgi:hypothetical protein
MKYAVGYQFVDSSTTFFDLCQPWYEGLFDTVKLATRSHFDPALVLTAYAQGEWNGNLTDLLEPHSSFVISPRILDNKAFGNDWFEKTSVCGRHCERCSYCEDTYYHICKEAKSQ